MKCSLLTLSCALDGELSQERQAELETHLVTCERCRSGMRYLREETERIAELARAHIPPGAATAILERARVLAPEAAGTAAAPPPEPGPVAVVEVPPLGGAPEPDIAGSASLPDLALWGPEVAGATAAGALDSIAVAGFPTPGQAPEAPTEPGAEPQAGLVEPGATPLGLGASPEDSSQEEPGGSDPAAASEGDIAPWSPGTEVHPEPGSNPEAEAPLLAAVEEESAPGAQGGGWVSSLEESVVPSAEEAWIESAAEPEEVTTPDLEVAGTDAMAEGPELVADTPADTVEDFDPIFQDAPPDRDLPLVDYQPVADGLWAADGSGPDVPGPPPPEVEGIAPSEQGDEVAGNGHPSDQVAPAPWGSQPDGPALDLPPAAELPGPTIDANTADAEAALGSLDPILGDQWEAPVAGEETPHPGAPLEPAASLDVPADDRALEPLETTAENPWTAAAESDGSATASVPEQRSWEPDPLPVWSPSLPPIPPWPNELPAAGAEEGSADEVMEVAQEEAAGLEETAAPAEVPVWIPPPPSLPSSVTDAWVPKRDLLDIPTQAPPAVAAEPLSPPIRPVDSVVPPRRPPSEETTGYQRIPPPHRPEGPGRRPVTSRPAAPGPRSWTRTGTIAVAALAVFLIGWALTHRTTPTPAPAKTAHSSPTPSSSHSPSASPSAPATTAPGLNLTGEQTFGGGGSGYQMQTARYGLHQNGTQLWVVFQMVSGSGSPKITTGFDGATTLYVEMQGVSPGVAVPQPPSGELVTSVKVGHVPGFSGAVYVLQLSRAAQVSGYLLPGTDTGSAGERVVLQLQ